MADGHESQGAHPLLRRLAVKCAMPACLDCGLQVNSVAFSPDGNWVVSGDGKKSSVY